MGWLACVSVRIKNIQANSEKSYQDNVKIHFPPWLVGIKLILIEDIPKSLGEQWVTEM